MDGSIHPDVTFARRPDPPPIIGIFVGVMVSSVLWAVVAALAWWAFR